MSKFCEKCGTPITEDEKFCPTCGTPLLINKGTKIPSTDMNVTQPAGTIARYKKTLIGIVIAILIIGIGGGTYYTIHALSAKGPASAENNSEPAPTETTAASTATPPQTPQSQDPINIVQQEFKARGIIGTVEATSYGHDPTGCLNIVGGKGHRFLVWDIKNDRIGAIDSTLDLYNFVEKRNSGTLNHVLFKMTIDNDTHDKDSQAGAWTGTTHTIPVFALYTLDSNGNVIPGKLTTGVGSNPSHLQGYLYEQKNVDMANLVLTEMSALQNNTNTHHFKL